MELNGIKGIVRKVLIRDREARNDDRYLYLKVASEIAGHDVSGVTLGEWMRDYTFPSTESVRRTRQKLQQHEPDLRSDKRIQEEREAREELYREFIRGYGYDQGNV